MSGLQRRRAQRARTGSQRLRDREALVELERVERSEENERRRAETKPDEQAEKDWAEAKGRLGQWVDEHTIAMWFEPLTTLGVRDGSLVLEGDGRVARWVRRRYPDILAAALKDTPYSGVTFVEEDRP